MDIKNLGISGIGFAYPDLHLNVAFRIALGLAIATIIFFADLYFIVKGMDDVGENPIKVRMFMFLSKIIRFIKLLENFNGKLNLFE